MRKRDILRILDEHEATTAAAVAEVQTLRTQVLDAHQMIDKLIDDKGTLGFVRVHQVEGMPTIEGVLVAREPQFLLKHAAMIEAEGRTIDLDGTVEILREHIALVQRIGTLAPEP